MALAVQSQITDECGKNRIADMLYYDRARAGSGILPQVFYGVYVLFPYKPPVFGPPMEGEPRPVP
jgi:hypothetical protein